MKKKLLALFAATVLCVGTIVPVSALEMQSFPTQSQSSSYASYVRGIQTMLINFNATTRTQIMNSGGVDGSYGSGTVKAVRSFQGAVGLSLDGICGKNTWTKFRSTMPSLGTSSGYKLFGGRYPYFSNGYNMRQVNAYNGTWQYYWNSWGHVG